MKRLFIYYESHFSYSSKGSNFRIRLETVDCEIVVELVSNYLQEDEDDP